MYVSSHEFWEGRLAAVGDRTEHLFWRIQNGEGPKDLRPKAVVVLIGTNDLNNVPDVSILVPSSNQTQCLPSFFTLAANVGETTSRACSQAAL